MIILGIETTTSQFSVALSNNGIISQVNLNVGFQHSQNLIPAIDLLLKQTKKKLEDINIIAVSTGPGSFTGIRIGIALAKTLTQFLNIKSIGISTLDALALKFSYNNFFVLPIVDALNENVIVRLYKIVNFQPKVFSKIKILKVSELKSFLLKFRLSKDVYCVGDGAIKYAEKLKYLNLPNPIDALPEAKNICLLAMKFYKKAGSFERLTPFYVKKSYVEMKTKYPRWKI